MPAAFDLTYLLVESVFGSFLLAGIGLVVLFGFMGMFSKMSSQLLITLLALFIMTYAIGFVGGLAALAFGVFALFYFFSGLINFIANLRG